MLLGKACLACPVMKKTRSVVRVAILSVLVCNSSYHEIDSYRIFSNFEYIRPFFIEADFC